jgi:uncharacterized membrane protein
MHAWGTRWGLSLGLLFWFLGFGLGFGSPRGGFSAGFLGLVVQCGLYAGLGAWIGRSLERHVRSFVGLQAEEAVARALADARRELASRKSLTSDIGVEIGPAMSRSAEVPEATAAPIGVDVTQARESVREEVAAKPGRFDDALHAVRDWFMGGNTIVRVGLVVLFFGLTFLARYAASRGLFPLEMRLAIVGIVGAVMLAIGFRQREARPAFALPMQGAGIAVMFLTIFAAFRMGPLIPASAAFALMVLVAAGGCALALLQNSRVLAFAAFAGAFATPVLVSTGQSSHVVLFGYYLLLNVAVLVLAARRSWRELNLLAFAATFLVAGGWGVLKYQAQHYATSQFFLIAFALIFVATAVLYARNTPTRLGNAVDSTLVFGTPLVVAALQAGLVRHIEYGMAFSSLAAAALYLVLAAVLVRRGADRYRLLVECFLALGVAFLTLAVPLALDARWTSTVWALEGAAVFWVGARQARWMPRAFGAAMVVVAAMVFVVTAFDASRAQGLTLLNPLFMGAMLVALPAWALAWWARKPLPHSGSRWAVRHARIEATIATPLFWVGFVYWCTAWMLELDRHTASTVLGAFAGGGVDSGAWMIPASLAAPLRVSIVALSAATMLHLAHRMPWRVAAWPSLLVLPLFLFALAHAFWGGGSGMRVLLWPHALVWVANAAIHLWLLRRFEAWLRTPSAQAAAPLPTFALGLDVPTMLRWLHVGTVWVAVLWLAAALSDVITWSELRNTSWASVVVLTSGIVVLLALALVAGRGVEASARRGLSWPLEPHAIAYAWHAALPIAVLVLAGALYMALMSAGRSHPLPYVPLLNPTELAVALGLAALGVWRRMVQRLVAESSMPASTDQPSSATALRLAQAVAGREGAIALAASAFLAINTVWLRIAHHFFDVPWSTSALFRSFTVQTGYAILWSLVALAAMVWAKRQAQRSAWIAGAVLLGAVVLKLLLIDMSNSGGAERVVAFMAVGVLMLIVGYFVPLPPRRFEAQVFADDTTRKAVAPLASAAALTIAVVAVVAMTTSGPASARGASDVRKSVSSDAPAVVDLQVRDFAHHHAFDVAGPGGLQRLVLPAAVLAQLRSLGHADLRIYDARGQAAPVALVRMEQVAPTPSAREITLIPIVRPVSASSQAGSVELPSGWSLQIEETALGRVMRMQSGPPTMPSTVPPTARMAGGSDTASPAVVAAAAGGEVVGMLADLRAVTDTVHGFEVDAEIPDLTPVTFVIHASKDLIAWRELGRVVMVKVDGVPIEQGQRLALGAGMDLRDHFLRITWEVPPQRQGAAVKLRGAKALTSAAPPAVERPSVALVAPITDARDVRVALPFATAVHSLEIDPGGVNTLVPLQLLARDNPQQPWRGVTSGVVFSLTRPDGRVQRSAPLLVIGPLGRELRFKVDPKAAGFAGSNLALTAFFEPVQLVFVARAPGTYTLAVGREQTASAFLPVQSLVPDHRAGSELSLPVVSFSPDAGATASNTPTTIDARPAARGFGQRQMLLWGVLVAGVATLGVLVWSLVRKLPAVDAAPSSAASPTANKPPQPPQPPEPPGAN